MHSSISEKIDNFFSSYPERTYPKGQILLFPNEPPEHIYYVKEGCVKVYDISYRGDELIINLFKNPAFFPMSWVLNRSENKYFYSTEEPSELYVAPVDDTYAFLQENPDVVLDLMQRVYRGVDGILERMVLLMTGTARSRVVYEIIIDCKRFAKQISADEYELSTNELGLAARTGLSRETISREINKLKENKLIKVSNKSIVIKKVSSLENLLSEQM